MSVGKGGLQFKVKDTIGLVYMLNDTTKTKFSQENIPEGYVPPTCWLYPVVSQYLGATAEIFSYQSSIIFHIFVCILGTKITKRFINIKN